MKNKLLNILWDYFLMSVGTLIFVMAWTSFLIPNGLASGGLTGLCTIVQYGTGIPVGLSFPIINVGLLVLGVLTLGKSFGFKTIYAIVMTSVMLAVTKEFIPADFVTEFSQDSKIVCTVLGGIMAGVGIGLSMSQGGSTGGTDIIALVWCKFKPASPGRVILIIDLIIITSSLLFPSYADEAATQLIPFNEKIAIVVYGLMQVTVCGYAIDLYISGSKQSVQVFIFTKKVSEMADAIAFDMKRGVTVLPAKGWFSKEDKQVLMVVTRKTDLNLLLRYVKSIDPDAFLSVSSVMGVYGQGFDTIKVKSK